RIVGRKGNDYARRRFAEKIVDFRLAPVGETSLSFSRELTNEIVDEFLDDKVDRVVVLYNEFVSAMTQNVTPMQLLPVQPTVRPEVKGGNVEEAHAGAGDFVYEPSKQDLLDHLVPLAVQNSIFKCSLESIASELGS